MLILSDKTSRVGIMLSFFIARLTPVYNTERPGCDLCLCFSSLNPSRIGHQNKEETWVVLDLLYFYSHCVSFMDSHGLVSNDQSK